MSFGRGPAASQASFGCGRLLREVQVAGERRKHCLLVSAGRCHNHNSMESLCLAVAVGAGGDVEERSFLGK